MTEERMTERYQSVNGSWPDTVPKPTPAEAMTGAKRLYRLGMGKPFRGKVKVTSGRRYSYIRRGVMYVNPSGHYFGGWKDLVHDLSHYCHRRVHPGHKPHDGRGTHAWIEKTMVEHVVNSGWLDGKLKRPEKKPQDVRQVRASRVAAGIARWEAKLKRAENALRKLRKQERYYSAALEANGKSA